jgi:hypothetical protein
MGGVLVIGGVTTPARAADVGTLGGNQAQVDVTETSIVAQHFDARDNEKGIDERQQN